MEEDEKLVYFVEADKKTTIEIFSVIISSISSLILFIMGIENFNFGLVVLGGMSLFPLFYSIYFGNFKKFIHLSVDGRTIYLKDFTPSVKKNIRKSIEKKGFKL